MDSLFIISGIFSWMLFLALQVAVFRSLKTRAMMHWLVVCVLVVGGANLFAVTFVCMRAHVGWGITLLGIVISLMMYLSGVYVYTSIMFGLAVTSIRMQMLVVIAHAGRRGITLNHLLQDYNRRVIVRTRLLRLVSSREVIQQGNTYVCSRHLTIFHLYGMFQLLLCWLYRSKIRHPRVS